MPQYYIKNGMVYGSVTQNAKGFSYMPYTSGRRSSRKAHATAKDAIRGRVRGGRLVEAKSVAHAMIIAQGGNPVS